MTETLASLPPDAHPLVVVSVWSAPTKSDAAFLRAVCARVVYVSSCAPLRERVWKAAVAATLRAMRKEEEEEEEDESEDHAVKEILASHEGVMDAIDWLVEHGKRHAALYNLYPFTGSNGEHVAHVQNSANPSDPPYVTKGGGIMTPDVIVRAARSHGDISALVNSLGCSPSIADDDIDVSSGEGADGAGMIQTNSAASRKLQRLRERVLTEVLTSMKGGGERCGAYEGPLKDAERRNSAGLRRISRALDERISFSSRSN